MSDATGGVIRYELTTTDANAAARFYGAVTGWKIADRPDPRAGRPDDRQIARDDGGSAGGVLQLTPDTQAHGAHLAGLTDLHVCSHVFDTTQLQYVRRNERLSPDVEHAKAFYARYFGFQFNEPMPMGAQYGNDQFIDQGGTRLGGMMKPIDPAHSGEWDFRFGVRSAAAARCRIEAAGGLVQMDLHQVPGGGDCVVIATDRQGARFGIVGPKGD